MKYDVIIIGSGLGGLECGYILSRHGMRVLILERQQQTGGCMQSYPRHGAHFDTGLHYVGGLAEGQPLHNTFKYLGLLDLPWQRLDSDGFDRITICGDTYRFAEGYDSFTEELAHHFPTERKALREYTDMLRRADEDQLKALTQPIAAEDSLTDWMFSTNAYEWLHEKFSDERLINVLSGASLKMELHKETLPLFTFAHGNSSFIQSSWRLKGDGNMLVSKLADGIRANGGEILTDREVTELVEHEGRITCALCADGERYEADTFISNAHPALTCSLVKESTLMRNIYKKRMARLENTYGMFTVSLKLKKGSLPYLNHNKYIYSTPDVWQMSEPGQSGKGVLVSCPCADDQLDILTPMLWAEVERWADTTVGHRGEDYKAFKQAKAEECIRLAETEIQGLSAMVEQIYTSTPLTYRDYNLTPQGTAYGIRKDAAMPMMTILTPRTPIPNLLMTGQNLMLHGLHGVTMTALFTCAEVTGREKIKEII